MKTEYPNWFGYVYTNFRDFLTPLAGQERLRFLQLGVFTGDASVWLMDNVLTHPSSTLTDVDTWEGSDEAAHDDMDFEDVWKTYLEKTKRFSIKALRQTTLTYLTHELGCTECSHSKFDFIYIDADHTTVGVLLDAELSWPLLKSGGIMAFDDYTWGHESGDPRLAPQVGIDLFLHRHQLDIEILTKNTQVWVKKR